MGVNTTTSGSTALSQETYSSSNTSAVETVRSSKSEIKSSSETIQKNVKSDEVSKESSEQNSLKEAEKKAQLNDWVNKMNKVVNDENVRFNFSEDFGGIYVTVVDKTTNEVIRTIPTEDAIKLSAIWKEAVGNIFDKKG
jgi:flagellar protein FlaG